MTGVQTCALPILGIAAEISTDDSKVKVLVIPTDEEMMIARDTKEIVEK